MFAFSRREASARVLFLGDRPPIFFPLNHQLSERNGSCERSLQGLN